MSSESSGGSLTTRQQYALVTAAALLLSAVLAPVAYDATSGPDGSVAVVAVDGFVSAQSVDAVTEDLREARQNDSVKAVVLKVDSPGGSAAASERLYLAVKRTAREMPVVASVQSTGASGAYYAMLPARNIYVTPASIVGSVGVRGSQPAPVPGSEIRSGPDKASGTADQARRQIETLQRAFVGTVMDERGDRLSVGRAEVAHAKVYTGARAVQNGFADEVGPLEAAIDEAATAAGLDTYDVVHKEPPQRPGLFLLSSGSENTTVLVQQSPVGYEGVDTQQYLMVYGNVRYQDEVIANVSS
jgi:protease-4